MSSQQSKEKEEQSPFSGLLAILLSAGFSGALAIAITEATNEDEKIPELIEQNQTPLIFMTQMDSKVDDKICLPLEGTVWDEEDPVRPRIPSGTHPNCLTGDTIIESDGIISALRTFYSGPLIEISTTQGANISVTPNHMFLTSQGFIAADFLNKGDYIINSSNTKRKTSSFHPNNNRKPITIKQVFNSLVKSTSCSSTTVPASSKDLHGDAMFSKGNIDVVRSNSFLSHAKNASPLKHLFSRLFNRGNSHLFSFSSDRSLTLFLQSVLSSNDRFMSSTRKTTSFFRSRLRHTQIHGFASSSNGNVVLTEDFSEVHSTTIQLIRQTLERFSPTIQLDKIIDIKIRFFSGHLYDIQTPSTLYSGNSIILSNCRCFYIDAITGRNLGQL